MGDGCTKVNENIYFRARKKAAISDKRLNSRAGAADLLGVSVSTLADYELGITKVVPVDKVVLMAELYNCPEFKNGYCKNECPIGKSMPIATEVKGIEGAALRVVREFDFDKLNEVKKNLIDIASDGEISENEKPKLKAIMRKIDEIAMVISEIKLIGEKALRG